jgi:tetratricopeptide (TPR) repeat protein
MLPPSDLSCPISREIFEVPLLCADGFSYEKSFITKWMGEHKLSPMLGCELANSSLMENRTLASFLNAYKGMKQRLVIPKCRPQKPKIEEAKVPAEANEKLEEVLNHYYKSTIQLDECCREIESLSKKYPDHFDIIMNHANILRFAGNFATSLNKAKKLKKLRPSTLIPYYMKIRILSESGKKKEANTLLTKMQNSYRIEDHLLIETRFMSYALLSIGNRDTAYKVVNTYLFLVPRDLRAVSHSIYINLLLENYEHVITTSLQYLKGNPDDVSVIFHLAKAYSKTDRKLQAVLLYKQIVSIATDKTICSKALYEAAVNRDCNKEFDVIIQELEQSYRLDPREEADGYLAALYADKKMYEKAEEWMKEYEKRMDIKNDQVFLGIKAQIQENSTQYEDAVATYIRLTEIDRVNTSYYHKRIEAVIKRKIKEVN